MHEIKQLLGLTYRQLSTQYSVTGGMPMRRRVETAGRMWVECQGTGPSMIKKQAIDTGWSGNQTGL